MPAKDLRILLVCVQLVCCIAPKGMQLSQFAAAVGSAQQSTHNNSAKAGEGGRATQPGVRMVAAAAAVAASAASAWALRKERIVEEVAASASSDGDEDEDAPALESAVTSAQYEALQDRRAAAAAVESANEEDVGDEEGWEADQEQESPDGTGPDVGRAGASSGASSGKLWGVDQFPEGTDGCWNWDMANLEAAQAWECPCLDRKNCISSDRLSVLELYDYRKTWRLSVAPNEGGQRDCARKELDGHKDGQTKTFTRSFVVGNLADCCAASAGLAKGMSFANWAASRSDSRHNRAFRKGRAVAKAETESSQRAHLRAWIMDHRDGFEGPKGGSDPVQKWRTDYMPQRKRWDAYCESRTKEGLPIIGCQTLFVEEWKKASIVEEKACGHAKCNVCGHLDALEIQFAGREDKLKEVAEKKVWPDRRSARLCLTCPCLTCPDLPCACPTVCTDVSQAIHKGEHRGERDYAEYWFVPHSLQPFLTACALIAKTTQVDER